VLATQKLFEFGDHDLGHRLWWTGKMLDIHKGHWHLEGHNLHGVVEWRHIAKHSWF